MTKKELENRIETLEIRLSACSKFITESLTITEAKQRDYIVRTKYIGKITHKQLKEDFRQEIAEKLKDNFDSITNKILNYNFYDTDHGIHLLNEFYNILKDYEMKHIVIDTYGNKECK